jgi:hypothetical protein
MRYQSRIFAIDTGSWNAHPEAGFLSPVWSRAAEVLSWTMPALMP